MAPDKFIYQILPPFCNTTRHFPFAITIEKLPGEWLLNPVVSELQSYKYISTDGVRKDWITPYHCQ